mmetsp:Transcript_23886/g.35501  ORF Transcript_23886/g.35501 Transcript_23886/m.35501 type:complete len:243 (-) Transcript_23886:66-794(-)
MGNPGNEDLQAPLLSNAQEEEDIAVPVVPVPPTSEAVSSVVATPVPSGGEPLVEATSTINDGHIPREQWRDDFCDCCNQGCCHPSCLLACCCPGIAVGQVMMRFNLGLSGGQVTPGQAKRAFTIILIVTLLNNLFFAEPSSQCAQTLSQGYGQCSALSLILYILSTLWTIYIFFLIIMTRMFIRRRYRIKTECCGELEDCALTVCCTCCTISQMARHTADYKKECGSFCTNTGLPHDSPSLV